MMKSDMSYCRKTAVDQVISDFLFHCQYEKNLNEKTAEFNLQMQQNSD